MGQYEEAFAEVGRTDFRRCDDARCNPIAHCLKVSGDDIETKGQMAGDVLEEAPFGRNLPNDPGDLGPEVPGVFLALAVPCQAERLAGITGRDEMNAAAPRAAVEGSQIVPDRSRSQGLVRHPRHESGRGETDSLDIAHSSISGFCEVQAKIEASDTGAKADAAKLVMSFGGMNSHTRGPFHRGPAAAGSGSRASDD